MVHLRSNVHVYKTHNVTIGSLLREMTIGHSSYAKMALSPCPGGQLTCQERHYFVKTTSQRRSDVMMTLSSPYVFAGVLTDRNVTCSMIISYPLVEMTSVMTLPLNTATSRSDWISTPERSAWLRSCNCDRKRKNTTKSLIQGTFVGKLKC